MRWLVLFVLWAGSAAAQPAVQFFENHGCTIGPDSRAAAAAAGIAEAAIAELVFSAENAGQLNRVGIYAVLGPDICAIRLPQVIPPISLDEPLIQNEIVSHEHLAGCYFSNVPQALEAVGYNLPDYIALMAAGFVNGDLRFYATSPLETPISIQVMQGACGDVPAAGAMAAVAELVTDETFDRYVRASGANTPCDDSDGSDQARDTALQVQREAGLDETVMNAWFEYELRIISWAAGWRQGMTWDDRGTLLPPLCDHYP